jgi:hypothetical protein
MQTNIKDWYCCLASSERGSIVLCAAQAGRITYFIIAVLFDTYWAAQIVPSNTIRKEIFIETWDMHLENIAPEGSPELNVYTLNPELWDDVNAYLDVHGISCAEPCRIATYSG